MTVGLIFVVKCDQSVNSFANIVSDGLRNRTIWWYTSAHTKVPRSHFPVKSVANTLSVRIIYVNTGKRQNPQTHQKAIIYHNYHLTFVDVTIRSFRACRKLKRFDLFEIYFYSYFFFIGGWTKCKRIATGRCIANV